MATVHCFDVDIAAKYGVHCAVLLNNIYYWIQKNEANGQNFYDGKYWTYNSRRAFATLFPYMNARQIAYALNKLIDEGILETGNYNTTAYDHTLWYTITKKGYTILQNCHNAETDTKEGATILQNCHNAETDTKEGVTILQNCHISEPKNVNHDNKNGECISYINTNKKQNKKTNNKKEKLIKEKSSSSFPETEECKLDILEPEDKYPPLPPLSEYPF